MRQKRGERGVRRYFADDWRDDTLPVNVFLVDHPRGLCLFDTGQTAAAGQPGYFSGWYPFFRLSRFELAYEEEAAVQLVADGVELECLRWVVLSHLHTDHIGGVEAFAHAEVVVSRVEWSRAQGVGGRLRGYLPQRWPHLLEPTLVDFDGPALGPFRATHDLAGDGSLLLVPLPGHTAGHAGLFVRGDERCFLLSGDASHRASELAAVAPEVADWCEDERVTVLAAHDELATALLENATEIEAG